MKCVSLDLAADLSREEKLRLIDTLWQSLAGSVDEIEVPASHEIELQKRQERIAEGNSSFSDWEEAKERIFSTAKKGFR